MKIFFIVDIRNYAGFKSTGIMYLFFWRWFNCYSVFFIVNVFTTVSMNVVFNLSILDLCGKYTY